MRETLYLQLRDVSLETLTQYRVDGAARGMTVKAPLSQALAEAKDRRVIVVLPAEAVRVLSVALPVRQLAKARLAVPYALEDQLAEDVDTLHFSLGARTPEGHFPVAIIRRSRLIDWLSVLQEHGIHPDKVVCQWDSLPESPDDETIALRLDQNEALARLHNGECVACALDSIGTFLDLADPDQKLRLRVRAGNEHDALLETLKRPIERITGHNDPFDDIVAHVNAGTGINLLQGEFAPQSGLGLRLKPWRIPAALAACYVVMVLALDFATAKRVQHAASLLEQQNVERFQALFPEQTRVSAALLPSLLEIQLRDGGNDDAGTDMMFLLARASSSVSEVKGLTVRGLQYRERTLYLSLTGDTLQTLENLRGWFSEQADVQLEVDSANAGAQEVQIRIKLSRVA